MKKTLPYTLCATGLALLAACASTPPGAPVPANLVPAGEKPLLRVAALLTADGQSAGEHYAGPRWEATDGSKIIGSVKARADAPAVGAIPWLLLTTKSDGGDGRFAKVTSVQRINTVGGVAPAKPCTPAALGSTERVPYTADYVLFTP